MGIRILLVSVLMVLLNANLVFAGPSGDATFDSLFLTRQLTQEAGTYYKNQMNALAQERAQLSSARDQNGDIPPDNLERIAAINSLLQELSDKKQKIEGSDKAWKSFEAVRVMYQTLNQVEASLDQKDTWSSDEAWLDQATGGLLASYRNELQAANTAVDVGKRLQKLDALIQKMNQQAPTPGFKKMRDGLNGLFWLMNTFGDKTGVPVVSDFLQKYGEAGTAMVDASERIFKTIRSREGNQLLPGRHGDDGRYDAFERQFPNLAARMDIIKPQLPGLPHVYESGDGGVLIWDAQRKTWYRTHPVHPESASLPRFNGIANDAASLGPREIMQRYLFLKQHGDQSPSPSTVLTDPDRVVALSLRSDRQVTAPGGQIKLSMRAITMSGDPKPILLASLRAKPKANLTEALMSSRYGVIKPSLIDLSAPELAIWTAPEIGNTVFEISAALSDANEDAGLEQVGKAVVEVATGDPTRLTMRVEPAVCEPMADGQVYFALTDGQGKPVAAAEGKSAAELIVLEAQGGLLVESPRWVDKAAGKGWAAWHAPAAPGQYKLLGTFRGFSEFGVLSSRGVLGARHEAVITVVGDDSGVGKGTDPQALLEQCVLSIGNFSAAPDISGSDLSGDAPVKVRASLGYDLTVPVKGRVVASLMLDGVEQVRKTRDLEPGSRHLNEEVMLEIPAGKAIGNHQATAAVSLELILKSNGDVLQGPSDSRQAGFSINAPDEEKEGALAGTWTGTGTTDITWKEERIATHEEFDLTLEIGGEEKTGTMTFRRTVGRTRKLDPNAEMNSFLVSGPVGESWSFPATLSRSGDTVTVTEVLAEDEDPDLATIITLKMGAPDILSSKKSEESAMSVGRESIKLQRK
jgi:hypothetical protein